MHTAPENAAGDVATRDWRSATWKLVLRALKRGPMHIRQLSEATDIEYVTLGGLVGRMVSEDAVVVIGTAQQAGMTGVRCDARMFALPGTPMLPPLAKVDEDIDDDPPPKPRRQSAPGSGQKAGPILFGRRMMTRWGSGGAW